MSVSPLRVLRATMLGIAVMVVFAFTSGMAKADEVTFQHYTNGCFNCGSAGLNANLYQTASLLGLSFGNSTFGGTKVAGYLAFGGNSQSVPGSQNVDNLGAFTLLNTNNVYNGNTFSLRVTFILPPGINGRNSQIFSATLTGAVKSTGNGGVTIDFDNTPILFTFSTAGGSGSFQLRVNDLAINPGQTAEITGQITSAGPTAVPEPAGMFLLGAGLMGAAAFARWRIKHHTRP